MAEEFTAEEKKFLVRMLWGTLTSQTWKRDSLLKEKCTPLETLGMLIFHKTEIDDFDDATFAMIYPILTRMAIVLGNKIQEKGRETAALAKANAEKATTEKPTEKPAEKPADKPAEKPTEKPADKPKEDGKE